MYQEDYLRPSTIGAIEEREKNQFIPPQKNSNVKK